MENKVYYGEYSLQHWINLIIKQNVILPDYQRYFVWNQKKVETLIDTIKNKQFVPPITIGAFSINNTNQNLILDGQQRLTSILLSYLGIYPDEETYKKTVEKFANEDDSEDEEIELDNILEWNLKKLTEKGKNRDKILSNIVDGNYKLIDLDVNVDFFNEHFLGFSYLVPQSTDEKKQQKYYSSVFRNINIQGEVLLPQESRAALYFLDKDLVSFFTPVFFNDIEIRVTSNLSKADFVRYLSLLSQYHKDGNSNRVARSYKSKMEKYYEEYIYSVINDINSDIYGKFSVIFPEKNYETPFSNFEDMLKSLEIQRIYTSIIELDMYFFGLIYHIIFKKELIDINRKDNLINELNSKINDYKTNTSHKKSPNNLGYLRDRITTSINIYKNYVK